MADDIQISASIDPSGVTAGTRQMAAEVKAFTRGAEAEFKKLDKAQQSAMRGKGGAQASKANFAGGQIAMQMQDVAVQLQSGAKATTIIAQQGSQIASIFGPQGQIIGGLIAMGLVLYDMVSNTAELDQKLERASEKFAKLTAANQRVVGMEVGSRNEADVMRERRTNGEIAAERLKIEKDTEEKIRQIRNSSVLPGVKSAAIEEVNRVKAEQIAALKNEETRKKIQQDKDKKEFNRTFSEGAPGEKEKFDLETRLGDIREKAESRILDLKEQGLETDEKIAAINAETAEETRKAVNSKANQRAVITANQQLKTALRQSFVENASWEKESALLNLRGSADEKRWKTLKVEEQFLRSMAGMRDPLNDKEAEAFMKTQPTAMEQLRVQRAMAVNQAQQADAFHDRTFGKSQSQIRKQLHSEEVGRRNEEKFKQRQLERGGLIDVQRDGNGNVIAGRDPITGQRVKGDEANRRMNELRKLVDPQKKPAGNSLADATVNELVQAFANEIGKIIAK